MDATIRKRLEQNTLPFGEMSRELQVVELQARVKELEESLSKQYGDMKTEIDQLTVNNGLLEAQLDELLSGIDKALTMYATGQPMQFVADKLAEVYDKIEAERRS